MTKQLHLLLADDDIDDRYFFERALKTLSISLQLTTVDDGEKLMIYLYNNMDKLPHVLFLDLNMPRKNGAECLKEIKSHDVLKNLPVIIYSTSQHDDVADLLYDNGAHYYVKKAGVSELELTLQNVIKLIEDKKFIRPERDHFILNMAIA